MTEHSTFCHAPVMECEALVIGGGIAGCWTALKLAERGIDTLLMFYTETDRGGRLGSTNLSVGAISTAPITRQDYTSWLDELGRGQVQHSVTQVTVDYLEEEINALKKFDPLKQIELGLALASGTGKKLVDKLLEHLRSLGVRVIEDGWIVRIDATENECRGVQYQQGDQLGVVSAAAIVLANGGYSGLFHGAVKTGTYGSIHARFLQAGGKLSNLEFVFKHGYGQPDLGKLTPTEELPGVEIYDEDGGHVLWLEEELFYGRGTHNHFQAFMTWRKDENKKHFVDFRYCQFQRTLKSVLNKPSLVTGNFDRSEYSELDEFIEAEQKEIFYDWLDSIANEKQAYSFAEFNKIKPLLKAKCLSDKHRIRQIAYFSMGGIMHHGFLTNLKNVYVNGEAMHDYGAHRVGGLPWSLYLCAARKIGDDIAAIKKSGGLKNSAVEVTSLQSSFDLSLLEEIQIKLYEFQERGKDEHGLEVFLHWLRSQRKTLQEQARTSDDCYAYLLLAEAIVQSSIARKESRGCFFRSDYMQEDYRLDRVRTIAFYDTETDAIAVDCVDKANIFDLVFNRTFDKDKLHLAKEKYNASYFLLKKHLLTEHAKSVAIEYEGNHLSYDDLNSLVDQYAFFLFSQGLARGDKVAIHLRDSPHWIAIFLASMQLGLITVPLNTFAKESDLLFFLEDSQADILISEQFLLSALNFELLSYRNNTRIITLEDIHPLQNEKIGGCVPVEKNAIGMILYTSGSTGKPKGAIHSHSDFQFTAEHFGLHNLMPKKGDRFYSSSRLFFAYGLGNSLTFPLYFGCTSVLSGNKLSLQATLQLLAEKSITHFFSIPAIYASLVQEAESRKISNQLKFSVSAGEPLAANIAKKWVEKSDCTLIDGIGSTEALHIFCCNYYFVDNTVAIGQEVPGYKLQLLDDNNFTFNKMNVPGNLAVSGGSLALGYWNNPEASKAAFINNLLLTGDRYLINEEGYFVYLGRNGDMYKVSGLWVSTVEIESVLKELEFLKDAALVVFIDKNGAQKTAAFVVPAEDIQKPLDLSHSDYSEEQFTEKVSEYLKGTVSKYKLPNHIYICDELPRTATGKVFKVQLKEIAASYGAEQVHYEQMKVNPTLRDTEVV